MFALNTIALIFDFDDTLLPDSTSELLRQHGLDPEKFWSVNAKRLLDLGYDPTLAYLNLLLDNIGKGKPLGLLTNSQLRQFGETLDSTYYPGVKSLFTELRASLGKLSKDLEIEFYVISGGLLEVIK